MKTHLSFLESWFILSYGSPQIHVSTAGNIPIPHLSPASVALTTDFGTRKTSAGGKNFRVRNYQGTNGSVLNVTGFTVTGANPGDFILTPPSLSSLIVTNSPPAIRTSNLSCVLNQRQTGSEQRKSISTPTRHQVLTNSP